MVIANEYLVAPHRSSLLRGGANLNSKGTRIMANLLIPYLPTKSKQPKELTGQKIGRLTPLKITHRRGKELLWECRCECGETCLVQSNNLLSGNTRSCGCYYKESRSVIQRQTKPGSKSPTYSSWANMRNRCYREDNVQYADYGGRGITVCERWKNSFPNFLEDMGEKPKKGMSIERKNNNGHYEPGNCEWSTPKPQANNRRSNVFLTFNGKTKTLTQWSEETGIGMSTIRARVRVGWSIKDSLTIMP
jgi:hypothetical protein